MSLDIATAAAGFIILGSVCSYLLATHGGRTSNNLILVLALFAGSGSLLATGTIEMAGRYGYSTLLALFAFTMVFIFSPLIFYPIRRLSAIIRFASLVDFLTFRFRGKSVATVTCSCLIIATIPLFLAQLLALESVHDFLFDSDKLFFWLLLVVVITTINWRSIEISPMQNLRWIMAAAGLLLLAALGLAALVSVQSIFGSIGEMNSWVVESGQRFIVQRMDSSYSLFIIFLAASFALPVNFTIVISEHISNRQAGLTVWAYPLLMLLASIPIFPLLWSGIAVQSSSPLQDYLFALPALTHHPIVAGLGAASVILISIALLCSMSTMLAKMVLNSFILPSKPLQDQPQLIHWINLRLLLVSSIILSASVLLSLAIKEHSITDLYLIGFAGLAQLTPGMLASIYLPKANRKGFIIGLLGGMSVWLIGLFLPLLLGDWQWPIPGTESLLTFGMESWDTWAFEALMVNILLCTLFSVFSKMDPKEELFARLCMVDNIYIPARVQLSHGSVNEINDSLRKSLGDEADRVVDHALNALALGSGETRPAALRKIRDHINSALTLRFGVLAADRIMEESIPLAAAAEQDSDDIYLIESVLAIHSDRLTGIASELNKLRIHHREILNNLPVGLVALGQGGEILKWNSTMAKYTEIDENKIRGSLVSDLPQPWNSVINTFLHSKANREENLRIELANSSRWFNLQKSADQSSDNDSILLIEESTHSVLLTQNSINNERLASVGRLAAGVAHEIGNPVTGIACIAQNLQYETEADEIKMSAEQILSQTDRINQIVQSLINFSRGDRHLKTPLQSVNVRDAADEAIQLLSLTNKQPTQQPTEQLQQFICSLDADCYILGDHHQLVQVLINLLSNARDATADKSPVTIEGKRRGQRLTIMISDCGTGIDKAIQDSIFEPFVTSKQPGEGTGLGLWIVFNLVKNLDGEIHLSSPAINSDRGTTAQLEFTLHSE
jgi:signal transduction histidine kinase/Na+/proline symporter